MQTVEQIEPLLDAVLIGGNHLASSLLNAGIDPVQHWDRSYHAIAACYGQPIADMFVAWRAIINLRNAIHMEES